jgi:hypothetical protein
MLSYNKKYKDIMFFKKLTLFRKEKKLHPNQQV